MFLVRPVRTQDLEALLKLAALAPLGMTNFPKNEERLSKYIAKSVTSFKKEVKTPGLEYYLFVLEDLNTHEIVGISAIFAKTKPLDYYKIEGNVLKRVHYEEGPTEICSLFINEKARKEGLGKLLSLSRFLFMAAFKHRFTKEVFAEIQGVRLNGQDPPFWEEVGKKFLPISFLELIHRRDLGDSSCIQAMPRLPIRIDLLPVEARLAIGETQSGSRAALHMLENEGFTKNGELDLFDAGPRVIAKLENIKTIRESQKVKIDEVPKNKVLISNDQLDFRSTFGEIDSALLTALNAPDEVRFLP